MNALVTTIIPVKNGIDFIHDAIYSILDQNYANTEIIVVDDGSDDYDYQQLSQIDPRIIVTRLNGKGVSAARNHGMEIARGEYLAFLDADDVWFPGKLQAQIGYFERHPEVGCVFGGFTKWFADESGIFPPWKSLSHDCSNASECEPERSGWLYTRLLCGLLVGMNTAIIRREVFEKLGGFDESMRIGEDYLFWLKVSRLFEMHSLNDTVALYRIHQKSAMSYRLDTENHQARLLAIAKQRWGLSNPDGTFLLENEFNHRLAETEFVHGYNHYWRGNPRVAMAAFRKAFIGKALQARSAAYFILAAFKFLVSPAKYR